MLGRPVSTCPARCCLKLDPSRLELDRGIVPAEGIVQGPVPDEVSAPRDGNERRRVWHRRRTHGLYRLPLLDCGYRGRFRGCRGRRRCFALPGQPCLAPRRSPRIGAESRWGRARRDGFLAEPQCLDVPGIGKSLAPSSLLPSVGTSPAVLGNETIFALGWLKSKHEVRSPTTARRQAVMFVWNREFVMVIGKALLDETDERGVIELWS